MGKTTSKTKSYSVWGRYWSSVQYFFSFLISLWFINKNIYTNTKKKVEDFKQNLQLHGVGGVGYRLDEWSVLVTLRKMITILLVWPWVSFCRVYMFLLVWVFGKSSFIPPSKIKLAKWSFSTTVQREFIRFLKNIYLSQIFCLTEWVQLNTQPLGDSRWVRYPGHLIQSSYINSIWTGRSFKDASSKRPSS